MSEYISREAVMDALLHEQYGYLCEDAINAIPNADVRPVVRGKWQKIGQWGVIAVCSVCGKSPDRKTNFCPNCGADMREES